MRKLPCYASLLQANAELEALLGTLWLKVMQPVAAKLADFGVTLGAELTLLPQGDLALLPLHAAWRMVDGHRRAILDDYIVSYAPSGAVLATARERLARRKVDKVVDSYGHGKGLFGVFNPPTVAMTTLSQAEKTELPALQSLFMARGDAVNTCIGYEVTLQRVLAEAPRAGYIHFACHGRFDQNEPEKSGLALAGEHLTVPHIIRKLRLPHCRLATLSACETGVVDVVYLQDEFIGLPAAFLQVGAIGVIATLWNVLDKATAALFPHFFSVHLKDGQNAPAAALRQAVLWLRDIGTFEHSDLEHNAPKNGALPRQRPYTPRAEELFRMPIVWAAFAHHGA
jgi:CHAT domain-containing protein